MKLAFGLFVALVSLLAPPAFAVDFYWRNGAQAAINYSSAVAACQGAADHYSSTTGYTVTVDKLVFNSDTSATCKLLRNGSPNLLSTMLARYGDSCPVNTEYDSQTGECKAPDNPCQQKAGMATSWSRTGTAPDDHVKIVNKMVFPPTTGCVDSCAIETDRRDCTARSTGAYYCKGTGTFTGQQCSTSGTGSEFIPEDQFESPEPQTIKSDEPCVYATDGDKQVCNSKNEVEVEGKICLTKADGSEVCVTKVPTKNGIDIRTEVTKQILADGSTVTTKKDTATITKCAGVNDCKTSTSTTTTTTTKDVNGNTISSGSSCVGDACGGSGGGSAGGNQSNCSPGEECEEGFGGPENEEVPGFGESLGTFMSAVSGSPIVSAASDAFSIPSGGSCSFQPFTVPILGTLSFQQICSWASDWLAPLRLLMLAVWAIVAVRTFLEA